MDFEKEIIERWLEGQEYLELEVREAVIKMLQMQFTVGVDECLLFFFNCYTDKTLWFLHLNKYESLLCETVSMDIFFAKGGYTHYIKYTHPAIMSKQVSWYSSMFLPHWHC